MRADINLLVQKGKAKILSRPKLVCLSGKAAQFLVGGEVPVVTISKSAEGSTSPNVDYKKYGISLNIKPRIRENGEIELVVYTEVKDIDQVRSIDIPNTVVAPAFTTRNAETELYLKDNETVFLAGLISSKKQTTTQGMPFLGKIPLLSWFFKNKDETNDQIELLISLTPHIKGLSDQNTYEKASGADEATQALPGTVKKSDTPATAVFSSDESLALQEYGQLIQRSIVDTIVLPKEGINAKLILALSVTSGGLVKDVVLKETSGDKIIDDAVIEAVKRQSPFPVFPPQLKQKEILLDIPIVFEKSRQG